MKTNQAIMPDHRRTPFATARSTSRPISAPSVVWVPL
jgi:hypothetical protein